MKKFWNFLFKDVTRSILFGLVFAGIFSGGLYVFATYGVDEYFPANNTLNPSCAPTDPYCKVVAPAVYTFGTNNFSGTGTVSAGAITGTSFTIGSNTISDFTILKTLSNLANGSGVLTNNGSGTLSWSAAAGMVYPSAGIAVSTGSAWGSSITDNSANWNTAYGWGNHASAGYLTSLSGALLATGATTGATSQAQAFTNGVITGKIYPGSDSTTALQINKANGTTNVLNVDTTNSRVGIGTTAPSQKLDVVGNINFATNGDSVLISSWKGANSGGGNIFIGGGGQSSVGVFGDPMSGGYNTSLGSNSLLSTTTGYDNTAIGVSTLIGLTTGYNNTAVGTNTLSGTNGNNNTAIGFSAGATNNASGSVFIGSNAGYFETGSNKLFIDNASRTNEADGRLKSLIYGVFNSSVASQSLTINGALKIGKSDGSGVAYTFPVTTGGPNTYLKDVAGDGTLSWASIDLSGYQPLDAELTGLAGLSYSSGTPFVKMTGAGTFSLDTNTYLTGNQTITLTGAVTGSGTTSILTALTGTGLDNVFNNVGFLKRTGTGAYSVDTNTYLTSSSLSGYVPYTGANSTLNLGANNLITTGNVGFGTTSPNAGLDVENSGTTIAGVKTQVYIGDTTSVAQSVGGLIALGGTYSGSTTQAWYGAIKGGKENATSGNYASYLSFYSRSDGNNLTEKMRINSSGYLGIANTNPGSLLDIGLAGTTLGTLRLEGNTSGYVQIQPSAAAGSYTLTLPTTDGDASQFLQTDGSGVLSWQTVSTPATLWYQPTTPGGSILSNATGAVAGNLTMTGINNIFIGNSAGAANASGNNNIFLGNEAGLSNYSGYGNILMGNNTGAKNYNGNSNVAIGTNAIYNNSSGSNLVALGFQAGFGNETASDNISIGYQSLKANAYAEKNVAIGSGALYTQSYDNDTGSGPTLYDSANTAIGYQALFTNNPTASSNGNNNTAIGFKALYTNSTGQWNFAGGYQAGYGNTTGSNNASIGFQSLYMNTTGGNNSAFGTQALNSNRTASDNTAIGFQSLYLNTYATNNVAIGSSALGSQDYANGNSNYATNNVAVGYKALFTNNPTATTNGLNNTALGYQSGYTNATGSGDVFLGYQAGYFETGSNKLFIDNQPRASEADARTKALIYGVFDAATANQKLTINGSIRMGALVTGAGGAVAVYRDANGDLADSTSSIRYKTNVQTMENVLPKIMALRAVRFAWNDQTSTPGMADFGMISEEVNSILPDLVTYEADGVTARGLKYEKMGLFALKGLQEQQEQIKSLTERVEALEKNGSMGNGTVNGIDQTSLIASLAQLGINFQDSIVKMANLVVEKFTAKTATIEKLEMIDQVTKEKYCTWIENGEWKKQKGDCASVLPDNPPTPPPPQETPSETPPVETPPAENPPPADAPATPPVENPPAQ